MADATADLESITGTVERLNCQKPNWCAGYMRTGGRDVSFSVRGFCSLGDTVTVYGEWETHKIYGKQFRGKSLTLSLPLDAAGLKKWLSWNAPQVGPVTAARLVDEFGITLLDQCGTDPEAVAIAGKLKGETVAWLADKWQTEKAKIGAVSWLIARGLTQKQADAVYARYGGGSISLVQDDPFELLGTVEGFGWVHTDALASAVGITGTHPKRMRGAVIAAVRESYEKGSTCANVRTVCNVAADKLSVGSPEPFREHVDAAVTSGKLKRFGEGDDATDWLATPAAYQHEEFVWHALRRGCEPNPFATNDPEAVAEQYRNMPGITLDDSQVQAVANALRYRISVITGGAGSGKTQVSKAIVKAFEDADVRVLLAGPTGKSARRMVEVIGHPASTIHRLLEYNGGTRQFTYNKDCPLDDYVILIDESSMISADLAYALFSALGPKTAVVLVGDPNQLPPVGPGSLLRDVIAHNLAPVTQLAKCHRQAGALKVNCAAIMEGTVAQSISPESGQSGAVGSPWMVHSSILKPEDLDKVVASIYTKYLSEWGFTDPINHVQFLTAKHDGMFGTKRINLVLQHLHQTRIGNPIPFPEPTAHDEPLKILVNDKVIQTRNNYNLSVMNGETGTVLGRDLTRPKLLELLGLQRPVEADPSALLAPILTGEEKRTTICPACVTPADLPAHDGWCPLRCAACGVDYVATDGSAPPPVKPTTLIDDFDGTAAGTRKRVSDTQVIAEFVVEFPDRIVTYPAGQGNDLLLAYCLSVHRYQGSQVRCAISIVCKSNRFPQNRNWLYTSCTRATKTCVILGDRQSIDAAAEKVVTDDRSTILRVFAESEQARP
jgi:exodeoxyribonuclease V alpha subunit